MERRPLLLTAATWAEWEAHWLEDRDRVEAGSRSPRRPSVAVL
jgi:hypothetical protein